ncbi:MAG TPA: MYXO-CTERM sorting domain-containing protein [Myxococcales bacterium]|jgi:uncharacterized protein (TIGR03382 family)
MGAARNALIGFVAGAAGLLWASSAGANGFALHAYGSPGSDANCANGRADWTNGNATGTVGQGTAYSYNNVSGKVNISAVRTDANIQITWSSQNASWNISAGCGVDSSACQVTNGNYVDVNFGEPVPALSSLSPTGCDWGGPDLVLTVDSPDGSFTHQSVVYFGAAALVTTFDTTSRLTAVIPAAQMTAAGTVAVTVKNPSAPAFGINCANGSNYGACPSINGGTSNALDFVVVIPPPDASTPPPDADAPGEDAAAAGEDAAEPGRDAGEPPDADLQTPADAAAPPPDAAAPKIDSGEAPDGAEPGLDAGEPEDAAAIEEDAGVGDGAVVEPDAAMASRDGGRDAGSSDVAIYDLGGCGCGTNGPVVGLAALALLALAGTRRRRG